MKIHLFIDAENMSPSIALEAYDFLRGEHEVIRCDVVGKLETLSALYKNRRGAKFKIQNSDYGKNSADMWLTVSIAKAIYEEPEVDLLAIVSNDRDFAPVVKLAAEKCRQVLLLVLESHYKSINNTLNNMKISRDFVTVGVLKDEPAFVSIKAQQLPSGLKEYYQKYYRGDMIFVKRGVQFMELPFIDGMHLNQFVHMMRYYRIWNRTQDVKSGVKGLSLKVSGNRIYYQSEEEMLNAT